MLWLVGQECDPSLGYGDASKLPLFVTMVKRIVVDKVCPSSLLKERLEIDKLLSCGLITNAFFTHMKRLNTQRYYAQHKFNLIRDENEGYSKLISFLHQPSLDESTLSETLSSYISLFNLDPNRVFDMILDTCEFEKAKYPIFRPIFNTFKIEEIPHLLEFKMRYYKSLDVPPFFKFKRSRRAFPTRFSNFPRAFSATVSSNLLFSSVFLPTKKPPWRKPRKPAYFPALFLPRPIHSSPSPRERAS